MKMFKLVGVTAVAATLAACGGGGDIKLAPTTNSNAGGSTGGDSSSNICAKYELSGQTFQGTFDSVNGNCTYDVTFVSDTRPLEADLTIPALPDNGIHIFEDSLFVGQDVDSNAATTGVRVPQDGEGPQLTIAPGAKIAFSAADNYVRIARGSRIIAEGTASSPIIFSAVTDLIDNNATESDRGLWGGVQINGNGITNKCSDAQRAATANNPHNCHITAEGRPSTYGGNNNNESSGSLKYVVIKHAGFEVVDGDELNGLTLNAVGSGTNIQYVQTYTTQDDGFEMFGGAVSLKNIVAVNVGDDSIDFSEGYVGNIQYALVLHTSGSNRCIEGDNTGGGRADDIAPLTKLRISNMTCITSNVDKNTGTNPSSKGDSEGPLYREGAFFEMYNSIITSSEAVMASNECMELDDSEGPQTIDAAEAGWSIAASNLIACTEATKVGADAANAAFDLDAWLAAAPNTNNVIVNNPAELPVVAIDSLASNPRAYITAAAFTDATSAAINVPVFDVTQLDDSFSPDSIPNLGSSGDSTFFESVDFIGAVKAGDDWVAGWTVGLDAP